MQLINQYPNSYYIYMVCIKWFVCCRIIDPCGGVSWLMHWLTDDDCSSLFLLLYMANFVIKYDLERGLYSICNMKCLEHKLQYVVQEMQTAIQEVPSPISHQPSWGKTQHIATDANQNVSTIYLNTQYSSGRRTGKEHAQKGEFAWSRNSSWRANCRCLVTSWEAGTTTSVNNKPPRNEWTLQTCRQQAQYSEHVQLT